MGDQISKVGFVMPTKDYVFFLRRVILQHYRECNEPIELRQSDDFYVKFGGCTLFCLKEAPCSVSKR